jgi:hypothetical protein
MKPSYRFRIGYLQRLPLKMPYPAVVEAIGAVMRRLPRGTNLLIDNTGVGRGIYDMLVHEGWSPIGVSITSGDTVHQEGRRFTVPKATLVSKLIQLVHSDNLRVAGDLKEWQALKHEMEIFRPEITPSGKETWNAAGSGHDDLLTATALCAWYIQHDDMGSWAYYELARQRAAAAGFRDTQPEEFVCAVDIGQSNDPTAICVMSRIDGPDPRTDKHFLPAQPESTAEPPDPTDPAWIEEQNEALKRLADPSRTGTGPLAPATLPKYVGDLRFHCVNSLENCTYQPGSLEYEEQMRKR